MRLRLFALMVAVSIPMPAFAAAPVNGNWYSDNKDSIVTIGQCGPVVCGKISKIIAPTKDGKPARDENNPNPALRNRPVLGLELLSGFKDAGKEWVGVIYDPRAGKSYKSKLVRLVNGNLQVKGCVGPFCKSVIFTPVK
jgi:uncharacterized protein (DUF2147 family)